MRLLLLLPLVAPAAAWGIAAGGLRQTGSGVRQRSSVVCNAAAIQEHADAVLEGDSLLIVPALATSNVAILGEEVANAVAAGADAIHVNVMDGHFVPKMTLGPMFVKALRSYGISAPLDVQITAVGIVDSLVDDFAAAGANYISVHPEGCLHLDRSLSLIKSHGLKCGIVLDPATPTSVLECVMDKVDIIGLQSINPGFKGEKFNEATYEKARTVRAMIEASGRRIRLEIDGGCGLKNIGKLAGCGVDMFVVGRGVFHADDYTTAMSELRAAAAA